MIYRRLRQLLASLGYRRVLGVLLGAGGGQAGCLELVLSDAGVSGEEDVVELVLLLAFAQHLSDLLGFALPAFAAPAFVEVLDAPPTKILALISADPAQDSAVHVLGSFSLDEVLILLFFLSDVLVELVVGLDEALPHALYHLLVLLPILHVHRVPALLLFDELVLMPLLELQVPPRRVLHGCEVLALFFSVVEADLFLGDVAVEDSIALVLLQQFVLLKLEPVDGHVHGGRWGFGLAVEGGGVVGRALIGVAGHNSAIKLFKPPPTPRLPTTSISQISPPIHPHPSHNRPNTAMASLY